MKVSRSISAGLVVTQTLLPLFVAAAVLRPRVTHAEAAADGIQLNYIRGAINSASTLLGSNSTTYQGIFVMSTANQAQEAVAMLNKDGASFLANIVEAGSVENRNSVVAVCQALVAGHDLRILQILLNETGVNPGTVGSSSRLMSRSSSINAACRTGITFASNHASATITGAAVGTAGLTMTYDSANTNVVRPPTNPDSPSGVGDSGGTGGTGGTSGGTTGDATGTEIEGGTCGKWSLRNIGAILSTGGISFLLCEVVVVWRDFLSAILGWMGAAIVTGVTGPAGSGGVTTPI